MHAFSFSDGTVTFFFYKKECQLINHAGLWSMYTGVNEFFRRKYMAELSPEAHKEAMKASNDYHIALDSLSNRLTILDVFKKTYLGSFYNLFFKKSTTISEEQKSSLMQQTHKDSSLKDYLVELNH